MILNISLGKGNGRVDAILLLSMMQSFLNAGGCFGQVHVK